MRRASKTTIAVIAALATATPAAQARVAVDVDHPASGPHLSVGQMHRIDGAQPIVSAGDPATDARPLHMPATGGGNALPFLFVLAPLGLALAAGGVRKATHRTFMPHPSARARA